MRSEAIERHEPTFVEKVAQVPWILVLLICAIAGVGVLSLYSAAGGNYDPWASRHAARVAVFTAMMLAASLVDLRLWLRGAYLFYGAILLMLLAVEIMGVIGMGAQRWLNLGIIQIQPSELMKVALVLALARYFHGVAAEDIGRPTVLVVPALMILLPVGLVLVQPDLGTATKLLAIGGALFFLAGVRLWKFAAVIAAALVALPTGWQFLHDYQRQRLLTFLDPENDPLGAGYHIMQSKIALGSGGLMGKGFLEGTQSHLNFLPEKQTDFIFTLFAEEWGLFGAAILVGLYMLVMVYGYAIGLRSRNQFGRLVALGMTTNLFFYVFINIAMVIGLIPVVGVPLPLVSYGGTAMLATMLGFGVMLSVLVHRDLRIPRRYPWDGP